MSFAWMGLVPPENSAEPMVPDQRDPVGVRIQQEIQEWTWHRSGSLLASGTFGKREVASFPGSTQLSVACSMVKRGKPGIFSHISMM